MTSFQCSLSQAIATTSATELNPGINQGLNLSQPISGICTDTRQLNPGELFIALTGENFDGHRFVEQAIAKGAIAAIVSSSSQFVLSPGLPLLQVPDPLLAYQKLANWWRSQAELPIIAVTGSAGKTTTKELIAALLSYFTPKHVHRSRENHNNDIGVAQTLLAIAPQDHDFAIVEMGMRGKGEIARLAQTAMPNIGVITNIGTAHIGRLGSQQAIAEAKCELLAEMPQDGIAILNGEDALLLATAKTVWQGQTLTYGIDRGDIQAKYSGNTVTVAAQTWQLPLPGRHNALNFLAALAVVKALGLDWQKIPAAIDSLTLPQGRAQVDHLPHDLMILDETYNASPEATIASLQLLADTPAHRRWAVLGTNKELGDRSASLHQLIGKTVANLGINFLIVLTDGESDQILTGANLSCQFACQSYAEIVDLLLEKVKPGDRLLFKASHSIGMDRALALFKQKYLSQAND